MAINVNRAVIDPYYRYKMPPLLVKVVGRGNGIKTNITNMTEIAKALDRPASYPVKYFGYELGAQTTVDAKNERYIVNGKHEANHLQDLLDGFIRKFILCSNCDNPETTLTVRNCQIRSKCKACGNQAIVDPKYKLSTYIVKNAPKSNKGKKEKGNKAAADEESVEEHKGSSSGDNEEDDDWTPEWDQPAVVAFSAQMSKLVVTKDLELDINERLEKLHIFFKEHKKAGTIDILKALMDEAERLDLKQKAPLLLTNLLFDANVMMDGQVKTYRDVFLLFTENDQKAQRNLLGGVEQLIEKNNAALLPKAAQLLKQLYMEDILEEGAILAWAAKPSNKYVSEAFSKRLIKQCHQVIKCLKAEVEEESEEDSGIANLRRLEVTPTVVTTDDGEEIDIDDI